MKKLFIIFALAVFTTGFAQDNKSEQKETVTTKVTVQDDKGIHTDVEKVTRTESQAIELDPKDAGKRDRDYDLGPTKVQTDVTYKSNGNNYIFENEANGYKMLDTKDGEKKDFARLRATSQKGYYIMSQQGNSSFGYFNEDGNFVVESYNPTTDAIEQTVYKIEVENKSSIEQNKM